jgi:hypothetical protein
MLQFNNLWRMLICIVAFFLAVLFPFLPGTPFVVQTRAHTGRLVAVVLANDAGADPVELVGSIGGSVSTITISGTLALIGEGAGLTIVDVNNPTVPMPIARLPLPEVARIRVVGKRAYVVGGNRLSILDVERPDHPALLGTYRTPNEATDVQVQGSYAYLVYGECTSSACFGGLDRITIDNPQAIRLQSRYSFQGKVNGLQIVGDLAYIAADLGLLIVDLSDPARLVLHSSYDGIAVKSVQIVGRYAYVGVYTGAQRHAWNELRIIDILDPAHPMPRGSLIIPNTEMQIINNIAYVAGSGLQMIDVSDPDNPQSVGSYASDEMTASAVAVSGNRAYASMRPNVTGANSLQIVDISHLDSPTLLGEYQNRSAFSLNVVGELAFVSGIGIVDVHDAAKPVLLSDTRLVSGDVRGNIAYLTDVVPGSCITVCQGQLRILDITNPISQTLLGTYNSLHNGWKVQVVGEYAYVADGDTGLQVIDIHDSHNPTLVGSYTALPYAWDLQILGARAYVADAQKGLQIFDITDPHQPLYQASILSSAWSVQVADNLAYVAGFRAGVHVVDVSIPNQPSQLFPAGSPYRGFDVAYDATVAGQMAYVAAGYQGIHIFDVRDPHHPLPRVSYSISGAANAIQVAGDLIYIATAEGGLQIWRAYPDRFPSLQLIPLIAH